MLVRNCIAECDDGRRQSYKGGKPEGHAWHRISFAEDDGGVYRGRRAFPAIEPIPDNRLTGPDVAKRFADRRPAPHGFPDWTRRPGSYTRGQMPYSILIRADGSVDQCLALNDVGPHAQRWSSMAVGVANAGNFTKHSPTDAQWETSIELAALLRASGLQDPFGHTELDRGSSDPTKKCPGPMFDMELLRLAAKHHVFATLNKEQATAVLTALGFVL